jgi:hypothetical protein
MKKILLFSLMLFSCLHAMIDEKPSSLEDAQQSFFNAIQDDTKNEQEKLATLKKILEKNPNDRAAILNYVGTIDDIYDTDDIDYESETDYERKTAFMLALEKELYNIVEFLVQQPEFNVNSENYNLSEKDKNQTPLETIIATLNSLQSLYEIDISEQSNDDEKKKKLIEIANKILIIHKDKINTQQLFDVYIKLLRFLENISDEESIKQNIENLLLTIINYEKFDVNHINNKADTPLFLSVINKNASADILKALIARGADLNRKYYPPHSYKFFNTPFSILDVAISCNKYNIAEILYKAGVRTINSKMYDKLNFEAFPDKTKPTFLAAINDPQNPPLAVNSWSPEKTSGLGAIGLLTILYDFMKFKKPEKVVAEKKDIKATTEKTKTKKTDIKHNKKESKKKKEVSRLKRLVKHTRNYTKDLLKNPRNHKKLLIPAACLLFRLLKDPIQYRNTRFA